MSFRRSACAVACTLDLIGDKWTLLIIRDLFFGKSRYKQFHDSAENIPTNILAERLGKLEKAGLIAKTPYQENPRRFEYLLTETGRSLGPVLQAIVNWAEAQLPGIRRPGKAKGPGTRRKKRAVERGDR
ncbi:MAG: helix-turn-helix transcriptional regulator [Gammaproteobacteria bacterium]|nr:helix-turn-helix transcriptional regulator [Gammaproteobacteria bacterium]